MEDINRLYDALLKKQFGVLEEEISQEKSLVAAKMRDINAVEPSSGLITAYLDIEIRQFKAFIVYGISEFKRLSFSPAADKEGFERTYRYLIDAFFAKSLDRMCSVMETLIPEVELEVTVEKKLQQVKSQALEDLRIVRAEMMPGPATGGIHMLAAMRELLIDLKKLVKTATEDFEKQRFASYRHYLDEFNRLLAAAKKMDASITMNMIAEVPKEKRLWTGTGFSYEEQAKLREVANAAGRLCERMQEKMDLNSSQVLKAYLNKIDIPSFDFIHIKDLIPILERDYQEVVTCRETGCWKASIILCGSLLEGILYDLLKQNETKALASKEAPKDKSGDSVPLEDWFITYLINTAADLDLIEKGIKALHHTTKDYRNLVHPTNEIKSSYKLKKEEADNAFAILNMLIKDLSES